MGEWLLSRRDRLIAARRPGTRCLDSPTPKDRPVGHGMIGRRPNPRGLSSKSVPCFLRLIVPILESVRIPARIRPCPTGRLFWGGAVPGTSCLATIVLSLRDKTIRPSKRLAFSAYGIEPRVESCNPFRFGAGFGHDCIGTDPTKEKTFFLRGHGLFNLSIFECPTS
jgi:hypothetical protein